MSVALLFRDMKGDWSPHEMRSTRRETSITGRPMNLIILF
jgi:hypothetical protein